MKRSDILAAARKYIDVRFRHGCSEPSHGLDCAGLLIAISRDLGYPLSGIPTSGYSREPDGSLERILSANGDVILSQERQPGDVGLFWLEKARKMPQHVGIFTESGGLIHTYTHVRKVVETTVVGDYFEKRLLRVYRFRGLED